MKVIKVIVDKIPKGCHKCDYGGLMDCGIMMRQLDCNSYNTRPDWCPLATIGTLFHGNDNWVWDGVHRRWVHKD